MASTDFKTLLPLSCGQPTVKRVVLNRNWLSNVTLNNRSGAGTDDLEYGFHGVLVALESGTLDGKGPCDVGDVWEVCAGVCGLGLEEGWPV